MDRNEPISDESAEGVTARMRQSVSRRESLKMAGLAGAAVTLAGGLAGFLAGHGSTRLGHQGATVAGLQEAVVRLLCRVAAHSSRRDADALRHICGQAKRDVLTEKQRTSLSCEGGLLLSTGSTLA